jgi:hypothetical protein
MEAANLMDSLERKRIPVAELWENKSDSFDLRYDSVSGFENTVVNLWDQ